VQQCGPSAYTLGSLHGKIEVKSNQFSRSDRLHLWESVKLWYTLNVRFAKYGTLYFCHFSWLWLSMCVLSASFGQLASLNSIMYHNNTAMSRGHRLTSAPLLYLKLKMYKI